MTSQGETVTLEGGKKYTPKADDPVYCHVHDLTVRWGELDEIQQLSVREGLDTPEDSACLLSETFRRKSS